MLRYLHADGQGEPVRTGPEAGKEDGLVEPPSDEDSESDGDPPP